jgi:hypothetical protein
LLGATVAEAAAEMVAMVETTAEVLGRVGKRATEVETGVARAVVARAVARAVVARAVERAVMKVTARMAVVKAAVKEMVTTGG